MASGILPAKGLRASAGEEMKQATALRLAVWSNDVTAVEELLEAGGNQDLQDEESGWSCLHHALYWGHLAVAARLISAGASLHLPDHQGRTPLDLLSQELQAYLQAGTQAELFAWGNGANFQLGTGGTGLAALPIRLDTLRHAGVVALAAAKFHSAAVTAEGRLLTWGWGRGGRLGHNDFDIHSGESATIVPRPVASLSRQVVVAVAAAKHHTAAITAEGDLYTWGANRHCQLGYSVDTQPTPRKIATVRVRWAGVAVANKHTLAVTDGGAVYSWGDNSQGQLGYGTTDSAANGNPRVVEAMKGKRVTAVAAAKRHSLAHTAEGDVWTWGHCGVSPRRVQLVGVRDVQRLSGKEVVFHRGQTAVARPIAVRITAGAAHSSCLTQDGVVLVWRSSDPMLQAHEASGALAGRTVVGISAGKYRTAAVTKEGDVFMWEGWSQPLHAGSGASGRLGTPQLPPAPPPGSSPGTSASLQKRQRDRARAERLAEHVVPVAVDGLKRAACIAVGEKHSLALQHWCCKPLAAWPFDMAAAAEEADVSEDSSSPEQEAQVAWAGSQLKAPARHFPWEAEDGVPTLQRVCERAVARELVEPRSVAGVLLYADAAGAGMLRQHCLAVAVSNLDAVLLEARESLEALPGHLLADMEALLRLRHLQPSGAAEPGELESAVAGAALRDTRRPTAFMPSGEDGDEQEESSRPSLRSSPSKGAHLSGVLGSAASFGSERSFKSEADATEDAAAFRQVRHLRKKLQQIEALEGRAAGGEALNAQQAFKVAQRPQVVAALAALAAGAPVSSLASLLAPQMLHQESLDKMPSADKGQAVAEDGSAAAGGRVGRQQRRQRKQKEGAVAAAPAGPDLASAMRALPPVAPNSAPQLTQPASPAVSAGAAGLVAPVTAGGMQVTSGFEVASDSQSAAAASSAGAVLAAQPPTRKTAKPPRKGGLSLFLRGDLDKDASSEPAASVAPAAPRGWALPAAPPATAGLTPRPASGFASAATPAAPKGWGAPAAASAPSAPGSAEGPAISGSAKSGHSSVADPQVSSLTAGLARQRLEAEAPAPEGPSPVLLPRARSGSGSRAGAPGGGGPAQRQQPDELPPSTGRRVSLADLMSPKSAPIPMRSTPPAWGAAKGASPTNGLPSLRDIQAVQEQHRESVAANWTPLGSSPGQGQGSAPSASWRVGASPQAGRVLGSSPGALFPAGTSPSSRRTPQRDAPSSKWFVPEEHVVVPLREIERQAQEEQLRAQEEAETLAAIAAAKEAERAQRKAEAKERKRAAKLLAAQLAASAAVGGTGAASSPPAAAQAEGRAPDKARRPRRSRGASGKTNSGPAAAAGDPKPVQPDGAGPLPPKRRPRGPRAGRPGPGHSRQPLDPASGAALSDGQSQALPA